MSQIAMTAWLRNLFRQVPLHVLFLSAYPIISVLGFNISQVYPRDAFRVLLISISAAAVVLVALRLLTGKWQLAGLLSSLLAVWFFYYGRLYVLMKGVAFLGFTLGRHRYLLILWSVIALVSALVMIRNRGRRSDLTLGLNIFSLVLLCLPVIQIAAYQIRNLNTTPTVSDNSPTSLISWSETSDPPDIYFIVLDAYSRSDVLKQEFGIDNSEFLGEFQRMGFTIAECSQSNYTRTIDALTSTFNMEYVQNLIPGLSSNLDRDRLLPYLKNNVVRLQLESLGYQTIVFKNPWERLLWDDADIVYRSNVGLTPFEYLLLRTTIVRPFLDLRILNNSQLADYANYQDTVYALTQLPRTTDIPGPKFVFAHLVIPHPPFVFGPDGDKIHIPYDADSGNIYTEEDYKRGYVAAVTYINQRMLEIIPNLIRSTDRPPIIILAGDHGTPWGGSQNEVKNLIAWFTPGHDSLGYDHITPVNIFRVIFDTYFNGQFGLLPDRSYFSAETEYIELLDSINACNQPN